MRLWSKFLISEIPCQQLLSQWRECCCIAKNLSDNGTPNHLLVNKILDYSLCHFTSYTKLVIDEMRSRGYKISKVALDNFNDNIDGASRKLDDYNKCNTMPIELIYKDWMNETYIVINIYNLYKKHLCGGLTDDEWNKIYHKYYKYMDYL